MPLSSCITSACIWKETGITWKPGKIAFEDPIGILDVSILQENILSPLLGIQDPRTDNRIDFVGGIRGLKELGKKEWTASR